MNENERGLFSSGRVFFQGLTVQVDEAGNMIIARILGGSTAARQGLLRTGEVILEVNGKQVRSPEELQQVIQDAKENLSLKVAPGLATDANRPLRSTVSETPVYYFSTSMPPVTVTFLLCLFTVLVRRMSRRNRSAMIPS